jgi:hypothetical protein
MLKIKIKRKKWKLKYLECNCYMPKQKTSAPKKFRATTREERMLGAAPSIVQIPDYMKLKHSNEKRMNNNIEL